MSWPHRRPCLLLQWLAGWRLQSDQIKHPPHIWWVRCFGRTWRTHFFKPCKKCQLCNSYNLLHSVNRSNSAADEKQPTQNHINLSLAESISCPHFTNICYYLFIPTPSPMWIYYTHFLFI